jgi:hypothetical protein
MVYKLLILAIAHMLLTLVPLGFDQQKTESDEAYSVGFRMRQFPASKDYNWRGSNERNLSGLFGIQPKTMARKKTSTSAPPRHLSL